MEAPRAFTFGLLQSKIAQLSCVVITCKLLAICITLLWGRLALLAMTTFDVLQGRDWHAGNVLKKIDFQPQPERSRVQALEFKWSSMGLEFESSLEF